MNRLIILYFTVILLSSCQSESPNILIKGELKQWHKVTLIIDGPETSENARVNPFLDYQLKATFTNGDHTIEVPGFYAADANSAETSAAEGNKWMVRFRPDLTGNWKYTVSFKTAKNIAVNENTEEARPIPGDGLTGEFTIHESDKNAPDFRGIGRVFYDGGSYFRQSNGNVFLKNGADSPENFLAFADFDQTYRYGLVDSALIDESEAKNNIHQFKPHIKDWKEGDPNWKGDKGKGIIGALNYLASQGVNAQYMLTLNIHGDGKDVWPWCDRNERYRFDCSKLDQWEIVFDHMDSLGMMIHLVLQETENECMLDVGKLGTQRKLYLQELIARFGHHLAVEWNLGEENGPSPSYPIGQSHKMKCDMAAYIREINPYPSIVVLHTHGGDERQDKYLTPFLGTKYIEGPSLQVGNPKRIHERVKHWVEASSKSGQNWIVSMDELGQYWNGIMPDQDDPQHDTVRYQALWGTMMAGGAGMEWYFGYIFLHNDLSCEDYSIREKWWEQTRICLDFFKTYLPFEDMKSMDNLVDSKGAYCFAKQGDVYAIYIPKNGTTTKLNLKNTNGEYSIQWYNPLFGGDLQNGSITKTRGGKNVELGLPPSEPDKDWVILVKRQ